MFNRIKRWVKEFRQDWKNMSECSRIEKGYECKRKCKGKLPH